MTRLSRWKLYAARGHKWRFYKQEQLAQPQFVDLTLQGAAQRSACTGLPGRQPIARALRSGQFWHITIDRDPRLQVFRRGTNVPLAHRAITGDGEHGISPRPKDGAEHEHLMPLLGKVAQQFGSRLRAPGDKVSIGKYQTFRISR